MIRFALICEQNHEFESWFQDGEAYDFQASLGLVVCPHCQSVNVSKAVMAPFVAAKTRIDKSHGEGAGGHMMPADEIQQVRQKIRALRDHVVQNATDVGEKFPEEARRQHFGEAEEKAIYGKASFEDVRELVEEGIAIFPIPDLPDDLN